MSFFIMTLQPNYGLVEFRYICFTSLQDINISFLNVSSFKEQCKCTYVVCQSCLLNLLDNKDVLCYLCFVLFLTIIWLYSIPIISVRDNIHNTCLTSTLWNSRCWCTLMIMFAFRSINLQLCFDMSPVKYSFLFCFLFFSMTLKLCHLS